MLPHHKEIVIVISVSTTLAVLAIGAVLVGHFTNWFQMIAESRTVEEDPPDDVEIIQPTTFTIAFTVDDDEDASTNTNAAGTYTQISKPQNDVQYTLTDPSNGATVTYSSSDIIVVWSYGQNTTAHRIFIIPNLSSLSGTYMFVLLNSSNTITSYALSDSVDLVGFTGTWTQVSQGRQIIGTITIPAES